MFGSWGKNHMPPSRLRRFVSSSSVHPQVVMLVCCDFCLTTSGVLSRMARSFWWPVHSASCSTSSDGGIRDQHIECKGLEKKPKLVWTIPTFPGQKEATAVCKVRHSYLHSPSASNFCVSLLFRQCMCSWGCNMLLRIVHKKEKTNLLSVGVRVRLCFFFCVTTRECIHV